MIAPDRVAAVLLAAGRSRRFGGEDKLLAELNGRPLVRHAAGTLTGIGFGRLIAIASPAVAPLLAEFEILANDRPDEGQSRSIKLGVEAAERSGCDAVLIALADMPFVGAAHYRRLLAAHERLTGSARDGAAMPPALFDRSLFAALKSLEGDRGARSLLAGAVLVEGAARELRDIDTPADLSPRPFPSS